MTITQMFILSFNGPHATGYDDEEYVWMVANNIIHKDVSREDPDVIEIIRKCVELNGQRAETQVAPATAIL